MKNSSLLRIILGIISVVVIDQWTKLFFASGKNIPLIGSLLRLETSYNTGIAFSIPITGILLILITIGILVGLTWFAWQKIDLDFVRSQLIIASIIGGGIGNLIDRIARGSVVDFIRIGIFPVFNIADIAVVMGGLLLFLWYDRIRK